VLVSLCDHTRSNKRWRLVGIASAASRMVTAAPKERACSGGGMGLRWAAFWLRNALLRCCLTRFVNNSLSWLCH
jgi:hypothetical protein